MLQWFVSVAVALFVAAQMGGMNIAPANTVAEAVDVDAYLTGVVPALAQLGEGAGVMAELMGAPAIADPNWQAQADAAFAAIQEGHAALLAYEPAQRLSPAHATLVAATDNCLAGAETAEQAIEDGNILGLYASAQQVTACADGIGDWRAQVDAMRR